MRDSAHPPIPGGPADAPLPTATRRAFFGQAAATATVAALWVEGLFDPLRAARVAPTPPGGERRSLDATAWQTLEAALARVLPSAEGSPGAREVNAIGYLDAALADPEVHADEAERVRAGARRLDAHAVRGGAEGFADLGPEAQDAGLELFEADWESQLFLRHLIAFAMEAFLGDPRHGGNTDEVGWAWAGHRPGQPRPPPDWSPLGEGPDR